MAIAPIDLQTIFTQVDKVGKTQAAQREGAALQQAMQGAEIQRKTEEHIKQINEAQNTGEGVEKAADDKKHNPDGRNEKKRKEDDENENGNEEEGRLSVLRDPLLGNKIDISL